MWEKIERSALLLAFVASIMSISERNDIARYLSWISSIFFLINLWRAPLFSLKVHWRSLVLYLSDFVFSILFIIDSIHHHEDQLSNSAIPGISYVVFILSILTAVVLILFPVPTSRVLTGKHNLIGTTSFEIPHTKDDTPQSANPHDFITVQCWFPLQTSTNLFVRFYQTYFQRRALLWTSGQPHTEYAESSELLKHIAINYSLPNVIIGQLSLAQTNSLFQCDFSNILKPEDTNKQVVENKQPQQHKFPVAIYSHGMYGWRQCHHSACELLASEGFLVFAVDHAPDCMVARPVGQGKESVPFNHRTDEPSGSKEERAFQTNGMNRRSNDIITLIDFLLSPALSERFPDLKDRIDPGSMNMWGHSYGGVSTVCCRDERVTNAVILDGWLYPMLDADREAGIKTASLLNISAELWPFGKYQVPYRADLIKNSKHSECFNMVLQGSDHQNYCDTQLICHKWLLMRSAVLGPKHDPVEMITHIDNMILAFFSRKAGVIKSNTPVEESNENGTILPSNDNNETDLTTQLLTSFAAVNLPQTTRAYMSTNLSEVDLTNCMQMLSKNPTAADDLLKKGQ